MVKKDHRISSLVRRGFQEWFWTWTHGHVGTASSFYGCTRTGGVHCVDLTLNLKTISLCWMVASEPHPNLQWWKVQARCASRDTSLLWWSRPHSPVCMVGISTSCHWCWWSSSIISSGSSGYLPLLPPVNIITRRSCCCCIGLSWLLLEYRQAPLPTMSLSICFTHIDRYFHHCQSTVKP